MGTQFSKVFYQWSKRAIETGSDFLCAQDGGQGKRI